VGVVGIYLFLHQIGNPGVFQASLILATYAGIRRIVASLELSKDYQPTEAVGSAVNEIRGTGTAVCTRSVRHIPSLKGTKHAKADKAIIVLDFLKIRRNFEGCVLSSLYKSYWNKIQLC
jgi:hypothetical protein